MCNLEDAKNCYIRQYKSVHNNEANVTEELLASMPEAKEIVPSLISIGRREQKLFRRGYLLGGAS